MYVRSISHVTINSSDERQEAVSYFGGAWKNRLVIMVENGNNNRVDEMTARGNRILGTIRNLLNM